ncbi:tRNA-splicing endonuclease subunit sen34 [Plakobranchus ocellatus]|uniref:tRNA-splicing endonuclease subunit SEN34 n=1 Tax=Plakobranchus ocellatus TaxID=259542 RepID=A0AAV4ANZ5_9GAST|nr:tRNA-splicing endonuclease subunit sen34 [Plakobranchus ocellatus]
MAGIEKDDASFSSNARPAEDDENRTADDDELLLLSSPISSPNENESPRMSDNATSNRRKAKVAKHSAASQGVVNLEDDLDLEILEEVTSIPGTSFSVSGSDAGSSEDEDEEEESDESSSLVGGKINITYSNGSFFLWNAEDVHMLREECRIVGKLVGCLPRAPRQNVQLGLPLQLMPEEAKLLVDIDAAAIVIEKPPSETLVRARKAAFENVRQQNFQIQQRLYKKHRKEEVSQRMDSIIAGKKAKKRKLKEEALKLDQAIGSVDNTESAELETALEAESVPASKDEEEDETIESLTVDDIVNTETSEDHALIQIFTENPWKQNLLPFRDWTYPSTERDVLRYLVFKDLWGKGFYLTSGAKFGGDFLVYPGDPARYHSHYIAVCRSQFDEMPCLDLVSLGRLGSNVRKTALLCALDRNRKVTYTSLTWTGIS